jgi:hypothetical protein
MMPSFARQPAATDKSGLRACREVKMRFVEPSLTEQKEVLLTSCRRNTEMFEMVLKVQGLKQAQPMLFASRPLRI